MARAEPEILAKKTLKQIADPTAEVIGGLQQKPAVMGHSTGGLLTYMIADRGLSAVSVAIAGFVVWRIAQTTAIVQRGVAVITERLRMTRMPSGVAAIPFVAPSMLRIYGLRTVVFRQSCIYGWRQFGVEDQGWVAWFTIAAVTGTPVRTVHVVGGGARNRLLNQFTADATGRPVLAGPVEATALGNVLVQARAAGEVGSLADLRAVVRASTEVETFEPTRDDAWAGAAAQFDALRGRS